MMRMVTAMGLTGYGLDATGLPGGLCCQESDGEQGRGVSDASSDGAQYHSARLLDAADLYGGDEVPVQPGHGDE